MNEDRETVCAIVVTYNRKKLLLECLEAIRRQTRPVQGIYIIDNASTDGTPEFLKENGYINELPPENLAKPWEKEFTIENLVDGKEIRVYYVRMHENTGGAGGFHEGVKRAYEKGYDWLWLMDDDVEPLPDGLHKQLSYKHLGLCMHPTKVTIDGEIFPFEGILDIATGFVYLKKSEDFRKMKQYTYINYGCFEGMLLHRSVVSIVGLPEKKFFLYYDDTYYGYMINKVTNVLYIKDICFVKKLKRNSHGLNKLELYLHFRNYIGYLARKVCEDKRRYWSLAIIFLLYHIFKNIAKLRIDRAYIVLKGFIDGIRENWGYEKKLLNKKR